MPTVTVRVPGLRSVALFSAAIGLVTYLSVPPLLRAMGEFLIREDPLVEPVALAVIAAGGHPERVLEAESLFREDRVERFVWCRERTSGAYRELASRGVELDDSADFYYQALSELGVPVAAIEIVPERINSTTEEAATLVDLLRERGIDRVVIVTNPVHSRRQCGIFEEAFSPHLRVICRPSRHDDYDPANWWQNRGSARSLVSEYVKLVYYYALDRS